jgi:anti-anti-sigma regulatory factor
MALKRSTGGLAGPAGRTAGRDEATRPRHTEPGRGYGRRAASPMAQCGIAVRWVGPRGWLKVTGELTAMTSRHLDDFLGWLMSVGVQQITVSLATAADIDQASVGVLREAQAELHKRGGELLVTAARATTRRTLNCLA